MSEVHNTEKGRQTIELLYWVWYCIDRSRGRAIDFPSDLWEANRQFFKNWRGESSKIEPLHLHPAIPGILHELMASGMLADYPEYHSHAPVAGRFEQMESRNGGLIPLYPPFNFQLYITTYGYDTLEYAIEKGELGKALSQNGRVINWERVASTESIEDSRSDFNDSPNGSTAADSLPILKTTSKNSGHFAYSPDKRREIVEEYRKARDAHQVINKGAWAQSKHGISGRTLLNYESEFPEEK